MVNYQLGKIYKLYSEQDNKMIYIGSTVKKYLRQRLGDHKSAYKFWKKGGKISHLKSYDIFEKYGIDDCIIELLENYPCNSKDELFARETYFQKKYECVNKLLAKRDMKQWRKDNVDHIKTYNKKYKEEHKKLLNEKHNCECGEHYTHGNKSRHIKTIKHINYMRNIRHVIYNRFKLVMNLNL